MEPRKKMFLVTTVAFLFFIILGVNATAITFEHSGMNDPETEGWTIGGDGGVGVVVGSVVEADGTEAWSVNDTSASAGSTLNYGQNVSASDAAQAASAGWKLSARVRVVNVPVADFANFSVFVEYRDGTTEWAMTFGQQANGDPNIRLSDGVNTGPSFTVVGGADEYHLYELVFDPATGTADLFVNGTEQISNFGGRPDSSSAGVSWGAGSTFTTGHGNYNLVKFSTMGGTTGRVIFDFDDGTLQGWTPEPFFGGTLFVDTTGGNPGGFMVATDNCGGCGGLLVRAPAPLLGDLSGFSGLQWDEFIYDRGANTILRTDIRILGVDGTDFKITHDGPIAVWTTQFAPFDDPSAWTLINGSATFEDVISNVEALFIRVDVSTTASGRESGIDNIQLLGSLPGSTQDNPILPDQTGDESPCSSVCLNLTGPCFCFNDVPGQEAVIGSREVHTAWIDPPMASGYEYKMTSGSLFEGVADFPMGFDSPFTVSVNGISLGQFGPGNPMLFDPGVEKFTVSGISPLVNAEQPDAFPLKVAFNTPTASFTMTPFLEVSIDIKPGTDVNSINPTSNGVIPVAILTNGFDATTVDPLSVRFGRDGAVETHGQGHIEDVDGDGDDDMVLHFRTQETGIQCGDTAASLTGATVDGQQISGSDSITVKCK